MKKNNLGFSLVELLVVIAVIGTLALVSSRINFNPQIDKQNSLMFTDQIYTTIENIRNNAVLGKAVLSGTTLIYPEKWIINIQNTGSSLTGSFEVKYLNNSILTPYTDFKVNFIPNAKISQLKCLDINNTNSSLNNNINIEISGRQLSLSGCTISNPAILEIKTNYKQLNKTIRLNTVTGLIEKID